MLLCMLFAAVLVNLQIQGISTYMVAEVRIDGFSSQQSSTASNSDASKGNDGDDTTCATTTSTVSPWWQIDLKMNRYVHKAAVKPSDAPDKVEVLVSNVSFADNADAATRCGYMQGQISANEWSDIPCDQVTWGRYLILRLPSTDNEDRQLALCGVKVYERFDHVLTRAAAESDVDNNLPAITEQYWVTTETTMLPSMDSDLSTSYLSLEKSERVMLKSPLVDCAWDRVQQVRITMFIEGTSRMGLVFDASTGATKKTFYAKDYLLESSYTDLSRERYAQMCTGGGSFFSIQGDGYNGGLRRNWFIHCSYGGCGQDIGWFIMLDVWHDNICDWEGLDGDDLFPKFLFSVAEEKSNAYNWDKADVFMISAVFDESVYQGCISDCNFIDDGDYPSCIACNVYVTCTSNTLSYNICRKGLKFDKDEGSCVAESSCTGPDTAPDACYPNACASDSPCQNDGTCSSDKTGYSCQCVEGFEGDHCEVNIDDCDPNQCQNGGQCTDGVNSFTCSGCDAGFEGDRCEVNIDDCDPDPCDNGKCEDGVDSFTCNCTAGYEGDHCEVNIDDCDPNPCQNGGQCTDGVNSFTCSGCDAGFNGDRCEINIDDCETDSCENNGQCVDGINSITCNCPTDFTGPTCGTMICPDGYEGDDCTTEINECESSPCGENGQCVDQVNKFVCNCTAPYIGTQCGEKDGCHSNPCQNGANCTDMEDNASSEYSCQCTDDYAGDNCQTMKQCVANTPCENGECTDSEDGTSYSCTCDEGYSGENCDEKTAGSAGAVEGEDTGDDDILTIVGQPAVAAIIAALAVAVCVMCCLFVIIIKKKKEKKEGEPQETNTGRWADVNKMNQKLKTPEAEIKPQRKVPQRQKDPMEDFDW